MGEKDAWLLDPLRRPEAGPTGPGPQAPSGASAALGAPEGTGARGPLEARPGVARRHLRVRLWEGMDSQWVGWWWWCVCPPTARQEPGAAVGGGTPHFCPPLAALQGAGRWSPKEPFSRPSPRPPPPSAASPLQSVESSISDLELRRKTPLPSPGAPTPSKTPHLFCPGSETGRSSAKARAPGRKLQALVPNPLRAFSLPATPESPLPPQGQIQRPQPSRSPRVND